MRWGPIVALVALLLNGTAWSQSSNSTLDLSAIAAQANAALSAANAAQAAIPTPCATVPFPDTLLGSVGAVRCYARPDDTRPTVVQAAETLTAADGTFLVTWKKAFVGDKLFAMAQPINTAAIQPMTCNVTVTTQTTASGKCWMQNLMSTPALGASVNGLVIVGAAANVQIRVAGRDLTQ